MDFTRRIWKILFPPFVRTYFRRKPYDIPREPNEGDLIKKDFEALDCLVFFILGTSTDFIIDLTCEENLPSSLGNPLVSLLIAIAIFFVPMVVVCSEILSAVPGASTIYTYCYTGVGEIIAFTAGWLVFGMSISRVALSQHFFTDKLFQEVIEGTNVSTAANIANVVIYIFMPFVSKKLAVSFNAAGTVIVLYLVVFFMGYVRPSNWNLLPSPKIVERTLLESFPYFKLYYPLPLLTASICRGYRFNVLIVKFIAIACLAAAFHVLFIAVLTGNTPYNEPLKPWLTSLMIKYRPPPYVILHEVAYSVAALNGAFALMHCSSTYTKQMSRDGVIFEFLSASKMNRNVFFVVCSSSVYALGYDASLSIFEFSSLGVVIIASVSIIFLRCGGISSRYKRTKERSEKARFRRERFQILVNVSLPIFVIACFFCSVFLKRFLNGLLETRNLGFPLFLLCAVLVCIAIVVIIICPKFKPDNNPIENLFMPYIPVLLLMVASVDFNLKRKSEILPFIIFVFIGLVVYFLFGHHRVSEKIKAESDGAEQSEARSECFSDRSERNKIFHLFETRRETSPRHIKSDILLSDTHETSAH